MNIIKFLKYFFIIFLILFFVFNVGVVLADSTDIACKNYKYPWCSAKGLGGSSGLVAKFYNIALALVGVAALGAIIYGGILYTVSSGNPSKQTEAREWIAGAIWGLVLLVGAVLLLNTINPQIAKLKLTELKASDIKGPVKYTDKSTEQQIKEGGKCNASGDC